MLIYHVLTEDNKSSSYFYLDKDRAIEHANIIKGKVQQTYLK